MEETRIPFWFLDFWFTVRHKNHNICCSIALNSMQLEDWSWELLLTTSCFIFRHTQKDGPLFQFLSDDSAPWCSSSNSQVDSEGMLSIQTYINGKTNIHTHKDLGSCVCWKVHVKLKITIILLNVMWSFLDLLSFAKKKALRSLWSVALKSWSIEFCLCDVCHSNYFSQKFLLTFVSMITPSC